MSFVGASLFDGVWGDDPLPLTQRQIVGSRGEGHKPGIIARHLSDISKYSIQLPPSFLLHVFRSTARVSKCEAPMTANLSSAWLSAGFRSTTKSTPAIQSLYNAIWYPLPVCVSPHGGVGAIHPTHYPRYIVLYLAEIFGGNCVRLSFDSVHGFIELPLGFSECIFTGNECDTVPSPPLVDC